MVASSVVVIFSYFVWKLWIFAMADLSVDISKLPDDVKDKLAELELELSEGKFLLQ